MNNPPCFRMRASSEKASFHRRHAQKGLRLFDLGQTSLSFQPVVSRIPAYENAIRKRGIRPACRRRLPATLTVPPFPVGPPLPPHGLRRSHRKATALFLKKRPLARYEAPFPPAPKEAFPRREKARRRQETANGPRVRRRNRQSLNGHSEALVALIIPRAAPGATGL